MQRSQFFSFAMIVAAVITRGSTHGATFPPEAKLTRNANGQIVAVRIVGSSNQKRLDVRPETISAIAELEHLESLSLWGTTVNDDDMKKLADLKTLQMIDLTYTDVSGKSLSVLAELPKLIWLRLDGCDVDDESLATLSKMPQLIELYLKQTNVTNAGLEHLSRLKNLILLDLSDCRVSDTGLASLGHFPMMRSLWLSKTIRYGDDDRSDLTDRCVDYLLTLDTLTDLRIADSKLTATGLQRLRDGLPNATVSTERTGVTFPRNQRK